MLHYLSHPISMRQVPEWCCFPSLNSIGASCKKLHQTFFSNNKKKLHVNQKKLEKAFVSKTQGFFPFNFFQQKFRAKKQNKTVQKNMSRTKVTFLCGVGAFKLSIVSKKLKKFWCVFYVSVFVSDELFIASSIRSSRSEYYVTAWIQPTVTASTNAGNILKWKKEVWKMGLLFNLLSFGNDEEKKTLCLSFSILFLFLLKILLEKPKKEGTKGFVTKNKWKVARVIHRGKKFIVLFY